MTQPVRHLFLDLEDTVITPVVEGWHNCELINIDKVRAFMQDWQPHYVHLLSFAVWNPRELALFNQHVRPMLEAALGMPLSSTATVDDDILPACCKVRSMSAERVDFSEMSAFWGKHDAFRLFMQHRFCRGLREVPVEVALLDDAVMHERFEWPRWKIRGELINIDEMSPVS